GSASAVIFESDSNSSVSTVLLPRICPAILMAFLARVVVVVVVVVVRFTAVADDSGWSPSSSSWFSSSRFSSSSLPAGSSGGVPRLLRGAKLVLPGGGGFLFRYR